ncbi:MAG: hypothetical protein IJZ93_05780 [Clostridia bacterium]|nr:hypothetical protein [Clostridia bacterium]
MKKIIALALMVIMMFAFVSCGMSADDVKENLEKEGYEVAVQTDAVTTGAAKAGFAVLGVELEGDVVAVLEAAKEDAIVMAYEFEETADAKAVMKKAEEENDDSYYVRKGKTIIVASSEDALKDAK